MTEWMKPELNDVFAKAVVAIQKRAEKQLDWNKLLDTYVHTDLAYRASTHDSQLVLGRQGTGKTQMVLPFITDVPKLPTDEQRFMVPLDDKRSIRRIVFDPDALKVTV
jgi:hypothetical protein